MKKLARSRQNLVQKSQTSIFFKQSICWDPAPTLTYAPSFVPDVLFDLIGQSAIWRSVLSSRFNKIQTHKTVTIYKVDLLLSILLTQSVSPAQNIAGTKGGTASSLALGLMHGLQLAGVHQNLRLPCNLGGAIMQSHPKHIFWPGSLT